MYPRIFRLAMDIIPIQTSSVPCERVFSSGKETMAPRRRRISANLMEALQILKYSIKKGRPLNFTQGMNWTDELIEFEFAARTAVVGDAEAYGRSLGEPEADLDVINEELEDLQKDLEDTHTFEHCSEMQADGSLGEEYRARQGWSLCWHLLR